MVNAIEGRVENLISRANLLKKMQLASGGGKIMLTSWFFLKKSAFLRHRAMLEHVQSFLCAARPIVSSVAARPGFNENFVP